MMSLCGSYCGRYLVGVKDGATLRHPPILIVEDSLVERHEIQLSFLLCKDLSEELRDAYRSAVCLPVSEEEFERAKALLAPELTLDESGCIQPVEGRDTCERGEG